MLWFLQSQDVPQKAWPRNNTDALCPHFSLTPRSLYSLPPPVTAALYGFSWRTFRKGLQKYPGSCTIHTIYRRQLSPWRCFFPAALVSLTHWDFYLEMIGKIAFQSHLHREHRQRQVKTKENRKRPESRFQLFIWASHYECYAFVLQLLGWQVIHPQTRDICSQYVLCFFHHLRWFSSAGGPGWHTAFFLERCQEWVFWQQELPSHLIISSNPCYSQAQSPSSCCLPQREVVRLGSHRSLHMHAAQSSVLQPHQLALRTRLLLLEASAAGLCWFTDPAVTAKGGCWCNSCQIRDDCHKNTAAEKKSSLFKYKTPTAVKVWGVSKSPRFSATWGLIPASERRDWMLPEQAWHVICKQLHGPKHFLKIYINFPHWTQWREDSFKFWHECLWHNHTIPPL